MPACWRSLLSSSMCSALCILRNESAAACAGWFLQLTCKQMQLVQVKCLCLHVLLTNMQLLGSHANNCIPCTLRVFVCIYPCLQLAVVVTQPLCAPWTGAWTAACCRATVLPGRYCTGMPRRASRCQSARGTRSGRGGPASMASLLWAYGQIWQMAQTSTLCTGGS